MTTTIENPHTIHPNIPPLGLIVTEPVYGGYRDQGGDHLSPNYGDRFTGIATGEINLDWRQPLWWWFRGNGCGDDPWGCDAEGRYDVCVQWRDYGDTFIDAPSVKRAIAACREMGIKPLIVRNGEIVAFDAT